MANAKTETSKALILSATAAQNALQQMENDIMTLAPRANGDWQFEAFKLNVIKALDNERAQKCTIASLRRSVIDCARYGMMPNTDEGLCWLIPYWNGAEKSFELRFQLGYPGVATLLVRMGIIPEAWAVHANDIFNYQITATETVLDFRPKMCETEEQRGKLVGGLARLTLPDKRTIVIPIDMAYVNKIMTMIKQKNNGYLPGPWETHRAEMVRKTALIYASKYLPRFDSAAAQAFFAAIRTDSEPIFDGNGRVDLREGEDYTVENADPKKAKSKASRMAETMRADKEKSAESTEKMGQNDGASDSTGNDYDEFKRLIAEHKFDGKTQKDFIEAARDGGKINWATALQKLNERLAQSNGSDDEEQLKRVALKEWVEKFSEKKIEGFVKAFQNEFKAAPDEVGSDNLDAALAFCKKLAKQFKIE